MSINNIPSPDNVVMSPRQNAPILKVRLMSWSSSPLILPMYPIVNGKTLSVHGERLVANPANNTIKKLIGVISINVFLNVILEI